MFYLIEMLKNKAFFAYFDATLVQKLWILSFASETKHKKQHLIIFEQYLEGF